MAITVLVTGAGGSAAFNFIDSLKQSKTKYTTIGVDTHKLHLRLSNADYTYTVSPNKQASRYINEINTIIKKHDVDILHPQPDPEVSFFAKMRHKIACTTLIPSTKTVTTCQNKIKTVDLLSQHNIPIATSIKIESKKSLHQAYKSLKTENNQLWLRAIHGAGSKGALPIKDIKHAECWIDYWQQNKGIGYKDFMLSEFLPGKEFAFQSVWKNGQLLVSQARERQEYIFANLTASGQSSSPAIAMTVNRNDINTIAHDAIKTIDPKATGIFCVDLKENTDGIPCVIEINPGRFFTTSNFFTYAGCNMPDFYSKLALNLPLPKYQPYNNLDEGLYWVRMIDMGYQLIKE